VAKANSPSLPPNFSVINYVNDIINCLMRKDSDGAYRLSKRLGEQIESALKQTNTNVQEIQTIIGLLNGSGGGTTTNINITETITGGSGTGYGQYVARAVDSGIIPGSALYVDGYGAAYLATATDATRFCNAVCVGPATQAGYVNITSGGDVNTLYATQVTYSRRLILSVTAGHFTDNNAEAGKQFSQDCGVFQKYTTSNIGSIGTCIASLAISPPQSTV